MSLLRVSSPSLVILAHLIKIRTILSPMGILCKVNFKLFQVIELPVEARFKQSKALITDLATEGFSI